MEKAIFDKVKELSAGDKERAGNAGAIVDGQDFGETHKQQLVRELVRQVLMKFRYRPSHLTESVWRRGFSPTNQTRVREIILPTLKRHGYLELMLIAGSREAVLCVAAKKDIWLSWTQESGTEPPPALSSVIDESKRRLKLD